jgi:uncharacterized Ntn-hydrolase superfamily protein
LPQMPDNSFGINPAKSPYATGGDKRAMQPAAMLIVKEDGGVWLNNDVVLRLQVDDHVEPIKELRRLVEKVLKMQYIRK